MSEVKTLAKSKKNSVPANVLVKYLYAQELNGQRKPVATIAVCKDTGKWAVSICSPKDQFCKKVGRNIAVSRLMSVPGYFPNVDSEYDVLGIHKYGTFWDDINTFVWEELNNVVGDVQADLITASMGTLGK